VRITTRNSYFVLDECRDPSTGRQNHARVVKTYVRWTFSAVAMPRSAIPAVAEARVPLPLPFNLTTGTRAECGRLSYLTPPPFLAWCCAATAANSRRRGPYSFQLSVKRPMSSTERRVRPHSTHQWRLLTVLYRSVAQVNSVHVRFCILPSRCLDWTHPVLLRLCACCEP